MITLLSPYPAALIKTRKMRIMVVADLHIGWEMALSHEGIHVPTQTPKLMKRLLDLVLAYKPEKLLIMGDVKHTVATAETMEWRDVPEFFAGLEKHISDVSVIRGNHDGNLEPLLPNNVEILPASGIVMGNIGFFHGHKWPSLDLLSCRTLVMGHVHPMVAFRDPSGFRVIRQVWVKANFNRNLLAKVLLQRNKRKLSKNLQQTSDPLHGAKTERSQLFIMPSFNDFLGGRPLNEKRPLGNIKAKMVAGPVLRSEAVDMKNAEAYLLDGTFLGTLEQLRTLS